MEKWTPSKPAFGGQGFGPPPDAMVEQRNRKAKTMFEVAGLVGLSVLGGLGLAAKWALENSEKIQLWSGNLKNLW